ncbi:hypothetical protein A5732_01970 [Mycobacterium colombiense]|nr:hypothetical protein A5732_01970 [Mycobacterium colombiense]OMC19892.1 hypothetical protein A5737_25185 [Mycobacterium colombiense]
MGSFGDHHGRGGGGGGTSCAANGGAYTGGAVYQSGIAGSGLHSNVDTFHDMLGSHCAELIAGVAITATVIATKATAIAAVRRPNNHLMVGLPGGAIPAPAGASLFRRHRRDQMKHSA